MNNTFTPIENKHLLLAKYDRSYEICCDGCGETWTAKCEGFEQAANSLWSSNGEGCIACDEDLNDKYNV